MKPPVGVSVGGLGRAGSRTSRRIANAGGIFGKLTKWPGMHWLYRPKIIMRTLVISRRLILQVAWSGSPGILESGTPAPPLLGVERDASFCESKRTPNASSARMPLTMIRKTPMKIRRLKNADRVEQFFFMYFEGHEMAEWLRLEFEVDLFSCALFTFRNRAQGLSLDNCQTEFVKRLFSQNSQKPLGKCSYSRVVARQPKPKVTAL